MKHLISLKDWTAEEIKEVLKQAQDIKANPEKYADLFKNKTLVMLFQKTSTRTRLSFEAGMTQLGGHAIFLDSRTTQFALTEFKDEIKAVMRFGDLLMFRAVEAEDVVTAAAQNQIPVIDACSEKYHPCQALSDLLTMVEDAGSLDQIKKITWLGIENNVSNTLKLVCAKLDIKVAIAAPEVNKASIDEELNKQANDTGLVTYTTDLTEALKDTQYVHTDTWMDMEFFEDGKVKPEFKTEYDARIEKFKPFQLNADLIDTHCPEAKIMHCMPCHLGYEITRDAVDHPSSLIFDQAENRMHAQKAILKYLFENK